VADAAAVNTNLTPAPPRTVLSPTEAAAATATTIAAGAAAEDAEDVVELAIDAAAAAAAGRASTVWKADRHPRLWSELLIGVGDEELGVRRSCGGRWGEGV
jgi:hypothetical protein